MFLKVFLKVSFLLFLIALGSTLYIYQNMRKISLVFYFLLILNLCLLSYIEHKEKYDSYEYDYDRENPNALVTGKNIAGTVFASYPNMSGGLGWIL